MRTPLQWPRVALLLPATVAVLAGPAASANDQDQRIVAAAMASYNFKTHLKDDAIKVECDQGVVTLSGTVAHDMDKVLAEETVSGLPGVKRVSNQLSLQGDQPAERSDAWITLKVKAALAFHQNVRASDTRVETQDGVVTLSGNADTAAQKELTAEYAKDVDGVKEVHNQIAVLKDGQAPRRMEEKIDDASITGQVKAALLFHRSTHVLATKVATRSGVVTLRGEAKNAAEKALVTKLAEDIKGVKQVNNQMTTGKG